MSTAATAPDPTTQPSRSAQLLDVIRRLIDYGKELAAAIRGRVLTDPAIRCRFGTTDVALILARISRGLLLANELEAKVIRTADHLDAPPPRTPRPSAPRASRPAAAPAAGDPPNPRLASLPTAEQIAEAVRRRPIGAVIADICRDIGIIPAHPLWRDLSVLIVRHGGSLVRLVTDMLDRVFPISSPPPPSSPVRPAPVPVPAGTGPP